MLDHLWKFDENSSNIFKSFGENYWHTFLHILENFGMHGSQGEWPSLTSEEITSYIKDIPMQHVSFLSLRYLVFWTSSTFVYIQLWPFKISQLNFCRSKSKATPPQAWFHSPLQRKQKRLPAKYLTLWNSLYLFGPRFLCFNQGSGYFCVELSLSLHVLAWDQSYLPR